MDFGGLRRLPAHAPECLGNHLAVQWNDPSPVVQFRQVLIYLLLLLEEVVGEGYAPVDLVQTGLDVVDHGKPFIADEVQEDLGWKTDRGRGITGLLEVEGV